MFYQKPEIKRPTHCSPQEIEAFKALVKVNGQVSTIRVPNAEYLAFLYNEQGQLIAVGAIKNPTLRYREKVFITNAGLPNIPEPQPIYEIGFFSKHPDVQEPGLGRCILHALIEQMPQTPLFATTGNPRMARLLSEREFVEIGKSWEPELGNTPLSLYIRYPRQVVS